MILTDEELIKVFDKLEWDDQIIGRHLHQFANAHELKKQSLVLFWSIPEKTFFDLGGLRYVIEGSQIDRHDTLKIVEENKVLKYFRKTRKLE
jgi:hypothetical protein